MQNLNSFKVLSLLVGKLGINVTRTTIFEELQKHPDSSSLLAFSDLLDKWNIPNAGYQASVDELFEAELSLPFIACIDKWEFVLVVEMDDKNFVVSNQRWNNHSIPVEEFKNRYKGWILALEKDESSGEADYLGQRRKEIIEQFRLPFMLAGLFGMLIIYLFMHRNYLTALTVNLTSLLLFKISGLIASIFLLIQSVDANNALIKRVCGSDNNKNCNAILSSNAAKVMKELSWSEVGFFYFAGTLLILLFNVSNNSVLRSLSILNVLSLPYTFYSIYYQSFVAKQWCVFCCSVLALLWLEGFAFFPYLVNSNLPINWDILGILFIGFCLPIIFWAFIKPHLTNSIQLRILKPELYRYKYNKQMFQSMLEQEPRYALPSEDNTIVLGNTAASNVITLVSNPFCGHCSNAHQVLDELLDLKKDVKLQLVFISRQSKRELDQKVIGHFMALKSGNEKVIKTAISDWYKQNKKVFESWREGYPVTDLEDRYDILAEQQEWANLANIHSTPTIFINGRRLPSFYQPQDIKYVL